jgi:hypothetical protein
MAMEKSYNCHIKLVNVYQVGEQRTSTFEIRGKFDNISAVVNNYQSILGKPLKVEEISRPTVRETDDELRALSDSYPPYANKHSLSLSEDSYSLSVPQAASPLASRGKNNQDELFTRKFNSVDMLDRMVGQHASKDSDDTESIDFVGFSGLGVGRTSLQTFDLDDLDRSHPSSPIRGGGSLRSNAPPTMATAVIQCPIDAVGHLIGLKGANLKKLCRTSGCKIIIDEAIKGQNFRLVNVRGQASCVKEAVGAIEEAIRERTISLKSGGSGMRDEYSLPAISSANY